MSLMYTRGLPRIMQYSKPDFILSKTTVKEKVIPSHKNKQCEKQE
ncbi:hypothetical protein T05_11396 [Trichinella murrelli]|uniref:Uncharacterized protein n=1 Tax=Trichinella murrelli TaxID=144512 RepID=A0A0V0T093_9BILA|nr:hypothetical protein T05_11396 [Trichinella murrelli]